MGLHLYCIAPAAHIPESTNGPSVTGIGGAPVEAVVAGSLSLWVSAHESPPAASLDAIREHHNVVTAAMTPVVTPVPVRFGQYFADAAAARESIGTSHEKWLALLVRFAGTVELGLRVFDPARAPEAETTPAGSGSEYMARLQRRQRGPAEAVSVTTVALHDALAGIVLEERVSPLRTAHGVVSVAHLLHAAQLEAYHAAVERVRAQLPHLRLLSSGPWPPYSFVAE
jgi:hypothetical protein